VHSLLGKTGRLKYFGKERKEIDFICAYWGGKIYLYSSKKKGKGRQGYSHRFLGKKKEMEERRFSFSPLPAERGTGALFRRKSGGGGSHSPPCLLSKRWGGRGRGPLTVLFTEKKESAFLNSRGKDGKTSTFFVEERGGEGRGHWGGETPFSEVRSSGVTISSSSYCEGGRKGGGKRGREAFPEKRGG